MSVRSHEELESLVAPYVLGAVDDDEAAELRAHLRDCEECRAQEQELRRGAALLPETVDPVPLPEGLIDRVVSRARTDVATEPRQPRARVRPMPRRASRPWAWAAVAACGALLAASGALGYGLVRTHSELERTRSALSHLVAARQGITLTNRAGNPVAQVVSRPDGGVFVAARLRPAPPGRTYELWVLKNGTPLPAGTFGGEGLTVVELKRSLEGAEGVAVTVEPAGGSKRPTSKPILSS